MKRIPLVAGAACLLLVALALPAQARERCRPADPAGGAAEAGDDGGARSATSAWVHESDGRWVHEADSRWVHDDDPGWVHEDATRDWVHADATSAWVHETDYGWWAAVPTAISEEAGPPAASDPDADGAAASDDEICWEDDGRNECVVLANQIAVYRFRLELALDRGDDLWEQSLRQTIERLEARGARRDCPWVEPSLREQIEQTVVVVAEAVGVAAKVAAKLYRLGLF